MSFINFQVKKKGGKNNGVDNDRFAGEYCHRSA